MTSRPRTDDDVAEEGWQTCADPTLMLRLLQEEASERKLRLFVVAAAREGFGDLANDEMRAAVDVAERYADGLAPAGELTAAHGAFYRYAQSDAPAELRAWLRSPERVVVYTLARMATYSERLLRTMAGNQNWLQNLAPLHPRLPALLREVFGPLTRPVVRAPDVWLSGSVAGLAQVIYADRAFDRMPILADALEEAGCGDHRVLDHCRGSGPHVRGCWVLDALLGKS